MNIDLTDRNSSSELESMCDSDWLDISSSRASDTDSVVGFDSDRELDNDDRPASRRSFASIPSSRGSEVQAWEGLAEDSSDESHKLPLSLSARSMPYIDDPIPVPDGANEGDDPEEEQRVKAALDQSMMSTLSASASRSNTNSLNGSHSSIVHSRDLRLSFPDPLTSSRDELLNTSFEDVATPQDGAMFPAGAADGTPDIFDADPAPTTTADPGQYAMPAVPEDDACEAAIKPDFYIVLYGSSSAVKWTLIDKLLEKAAKGHGLTVTSKVVGLIDGYVRFLSPSYQSDGTSGDRVVSVIDRTEMLDVDDVSSFAPLDRPSLAVVFLPSSITSLPEHTLYLPVLAQSFSIIEAPHSVDQLLDAEQYWETLGIPRRKVIKLSYGSSLVIDQDEVDRAGPRHIARILRPLLNSSQPKTMQRLATRHAWTILAVLSVVLGYAMQGSVDPSPLMPVYQQQGGEASSPTTWGLIRPIGHSTNRSTLTAVSESPSSLKDLALAIISAPLVASTSGSRQSSVPSTSGLEHAVPTGIAADAPSDCACGCGLITWPGKINSDADLSLRPTTPPPSVRDSSGFALSVIPSHTHHQAKGKGKAAVHADDSLYALSTRFVDSLSQYFDYNTVVSVVVRDLQEIFDALDELVHAIGRQTSLAWERSKDTVHVLRAHIQDRHERARAKAQVLRDNSGWLIESVRERVRGKARAARENAKAVRDSVRKTPQEKNSNTRRRMIRERMRERVMGKVPRFSAHH